MWELSRNHCCATCRYSRKIGCLVETFYNQSAAALLDEDELFPLSGNLLCDYCLEQLGEDSVQAVLVRGDGRCENYDCDEEGYFALYGMEAEEDDENYALQPLDSFVQNLDRQGIDSGLWGGR